MKLFLKNMGWGLFIALLLGSLFGWIWLIEGAPDMLP